MAKQKTKGSEPAVDSGQPLNAKSVERAKPAKKRKRKLRSPKQQAAELQIERRRENAAKLKLAGWSMRDIAAHLKCSLGTVHGDIAAVFERTRDTADGHIERSKAIALARLDVATRAIWPDVEAGDLDTIDRLVKIEARRAKLEGTEAPVEQKLELGGSVTLDDIEKRAALAEANSK